MIVQKNVPFSYKAAMFYCKNICIKYFSKYGFFVNIS